MNRVTRPSETRRLRPPGRPLAATVLALVATCIVLFAAAAPAFATSGAFSWARVIKPPVTKFQDDVSYTARGPAGSMYVAGMYAVPALSGDLWAGRVNGAGKTLWAKKYGVKQGIDTAVAAIAVDPKGNLIVAGRGQYGTNMDILVLKYSPAGKLLWARHYNGPANAFDQARAVAVDKAGNILVAGDVNTAVATSIDYGVVKYSPAGTFRWANFVDGGGTGLATADYVGGIAVDGSGNAYVTGEGFGPPGNGMEMMTFKLGALHGAFGWSRTYNTAYSDGGSRIVYKNGTVYVMGFSGSAGGSQLLVAAYEPVAGMPKWPASIGAGPSYPNAEGQAIAVDGAGNIRVAGSTIPANDAGAQAMLTLIKHDGAFGWAQPLQFKPGDQRDVFSSIVADGTGRTWVAGSEYDGLGLYHAVVARYSPGSARKWAKRYTGPSAHAAQGSSISLFGTRAVAVGGNVDRATTGIDPLLLKYQK